MLQISLTHQVPPQQQAILISMLMFCICTVYYPVTKASNCVAVVDVLLWLMLLCVICLQPTIYGRFTRAQPPDYRDLVT